MARDHYCLDFETEPIEGRPNYPPRPVGFSVKEPGRKAKYLAFGHPGGNNCSKEQAQSELIRLNSQYKGFIAHNLKFDHDVWRTHLAVPPPPIEDCHDTMILGYLDNPHAKKLDLKSLEIEHLGGKPNERDELEEWILTNVPEAKRAKTKWGAYISRGPGDMVGRSRAIPDAESTMKLFQILEGKVLGSAKMKESYVRELKIIPIFLRNEHEGIPVDLPLLEKDVPRYEKALESVDSWIRKKLGKDIDIDKAEQLADAIDEAGVAGDWVLTQTGKRSTSKKNLRSAIQDELLTSVLDYRSSLANFLRVFLRPWLTQAQITGGRIHATWHSTRQSGKGGSRTGRISSMPNLQNIPSPERYLELMLRLKTTGVFKAIRNLPELPRCRSYIIADSENHILCDRDWSQQEPRVFAHFEDDLLCAEYRRNPTMDVYVYANQMIKEMSGLILHSDEKLARKMMKTIILAILYGLGLGHLAERLGVTVTDAKLFRDTLLRVFPGIKQVTDDLKMRSRMKIPMRTWGGRLYYAEEPRMVDGQWRDMGYKLINYLVQGSSADLMKEAIIRYDATRRDSRLVLTVHDEILIDSPNRCWKREMGILQKAMDEIQLDVPLVSDGEIGYRWIDMKEAA